MAIRSTIARATGTDRLTQFRKSAQTSARTFVNAFRGGTLSARAFGTTRKSRTMRNALRRKSTGGAGG